MKEDWFCIALLEVSSTPGLCLNPGCFCGSREVRRHFAERYLSTFPLSRIVFDSKWRCEDVAKNSVYYSAVCDSLAGLSMSLVGVGGCSLKQSPRAISMWWLMELEYSGLFGVGDLELERRIGRGSAGRLLLEMRQHAAALTTVCSGWKEYEALAPQRRLESKRASADLHHARMKKQRERAKEVKTMVDAFEYLGDVDRLKLLASDRFQFPFDIVPTRIIPQVDRTACANVLMLKERQSLVRKIGHRKGKWARLKGQLS